MDEQALIQEYEKLRRKARELDVQVECVDRRLVEIERQLPDRYTSPGDPPFCQSAPRRKPVNVLVEGYVPGTRRANAD